MTKHTLREKYIAALTHRGHTFVKRTFRYDVYTRIPEGFYYIGVAGSLRAGLNAGSSVPVGENLKQRLREVGASILNGETK